MVDTCNVTVLARDFGGALAPGQLLKFTPPTEIGREGDAVLIGTEISLSLDGAGSGAVDLVPGGPWTLTIVVNNVPRTRTFTVPDEADAQLKDLLDVPPTVVELGDLAELRAEVADLVDRIDLGAFDADVAATAASAAAAGVARTGAETARDAALLSRGNFTSTAEALSMGVIAVAGLVAGTGGTDDQFDLAITGGGGANAAGRFVVAGGAVTQVTITSPGTGYTSAPAISFAASTGSTASATAVIGNRVEEGEFFTVPVAGDPHSLILYQVTAGRIATEVTRYPAASIITTEATDNRVPRAPVGKTDLRAAWTPRGMIGLPIVLAENQMLAKFDMVADFTRGTYLRDGALMNFDQMFVPRRAEPLTRDGLLIPDASEKNRAYVGLNDKTFEGFNKTTQFASLTKEILELDALAPDERAWFLAQPLPFERVFSFVNPTGSTASAQALTMGGTSGTVTASAYLWNRAGNSQLSNGVQHTSAAPAPSGARLTATGTATAVQARLPAGAECLIGGMMLELGGSVTDYEDSLPVRNRLELRDTSIIDPAAGGTVWMRVKWPTALVTGSDEIFGLCKTDPITGERDRTTVLRVIINWDSLGAINITADDGTAASINLQPTWQTDLPILIAFSWTPDGTIRLCTNAGEVLTNATGKDLSGLNQMQIGGAFPQGTTAPFSGKFLRGNLEAFAYKKGAY
jgi:hypothetical protein